MQTRVSGLTLALGALLFVHAVLLTLGLHLLLRVPRADTLAFHVDAFVAGNQRGDSWRPMDAARRFAAEHPGASIYDTVFFGQGMKFQYPPSALLLTGNLSRPALNVISRIAVCLTVALSVFLFERTMRAAGWMPVGAIDAWLRIVVCAGLGLSFYPLLKAYSLGQIQVWIDLLFAVLVAVWMRVPAVGGLCLALICLVKPHFALVGVWGVLRRQWQFVTAFAVALLIGLAMSVTVYGLRSHVDYLRVIAFISERGEAFYANQSFNGLLNRALFNGENIEWQETTFAPPHRLVKAGTTMAAVALVAAALWLPRRRGHAGALDLAVISLTVTMASPVAWEHHYGILLPLFAVTTAEVLRLRPFGGYTAPALAVAFIVTGQYFQPLQRLAATPFNPLQSYVLFGSLLLLLLWLRALRLPGVDPGPREQSAPRAAEL